MHLSLNPANPTVRLLPADLAALADDGGELTFDLAVPAGSPAPPMNTELICWLDIETTGLDANTGSVIEVGIIVTDNALNEVAEPLSVLIDDGKWESRLSDFTTKMHTESGLLEELRRDGGLSPADASAVIVAYLAEQSPESGMILGGNSITFDRTWLGLHLPEVAAALHYRSLDTTGVREYVTRVLGKPKFENPDAQVAHRAIGDLRNSIRELSYYRDQAAA